MSESTPLLRIDKISKIFPGVQALDQVSLELDTGEIIAVVGENGAGKSTLMRILAGIFPADGGMIYVDQHPWPQTGVRQAMQLGISLIHQELNLAENLSVAENIFLGRQPQRGPRWLPITDRAEMEAGAEAVLAQVDLQISPWTLVSDLSIAQRQLLEIAKALSAQARILVFDEPTSSLSITEAQRLLSLIERLRDEGTAILYVSHHLREVVRLANRVVVLRDGQLAGTLAQEEILIERMISLMVGRDIQQFYHRSRHDISAGPPALEVINFTNGSQPEPINFSIQPGEIVGIAGLVGAGRTELAHGLFGIDSNWMGMVRVHQSAIAPSSPARAIAAGMALVPEDRQRHGLLLSMAVWFNICLAIWAKLAHRGWRRPAVENELATEMVRQLDIRIASTGQVAKSLSGGNQQKTVLAKWLATKPRVLLLDEPTRGIDIGAKSEIYRLISELAARGVAIMMISSEMEEIVGVSDRVLVMRDAQIAGELSPPNITEEAILALALGTTRTGVEETA